MNYPHLSARVPRAPKAARLPGAGKAKSLIVLGPTPFADVVGTRNGIGLRVTYAGVDQVGMLGVYNGAPSYGTWLVPATDWLKTTETNAAYTALAAVINTAYDGAVAALAAAPTPASGVAHDSAVLRMASNPFTASVVLVGVTRALLIERTYDGTGGVDAGVVPFVEGSIQNIRVVRVESTTGCDMAPGILGERRVVLRYSGLPQTTIYEAPPVQ